MSQSQQPYVPAVYVPSEQQSNGAQESGFVPGGQPPSQPQAVPMPMYEQQQQYQCQRPTAGQVFVPGLPHQQPHQQPQQQPGAVFVPGRQQPQPPPRQQFQPAQPITASIPGQQPPQPMPPQQPTYGQQACVPQLPDRSGNQGGGAPYVAMGAAAAGTAAVVGASYVAYQHYKGDDSYRDEFQKLDVDRSGHLERHELERRFGKFMPGKAIDAVMRMADTDKDGRVDMDEYVAIRRQIVAMGFATAGAAAVSGAGYLAYQHHNKNDNDDPQWPQSQSQHQSHGGMPSYATVGAAAAGTAAVGGAGYLAYQHHQHNAHSPQGQRTGRLDAAQQGMYGGPQAIANPSSGGGNAAAISSYQSEFQRLDADGSGHLERAELEKLFGKWVPKSVIDTVMKAVDADKDGKVSVQEYIAIRQQLGGKIPGF